MNARITGLTAIGQNKCTQKRGAVTPVKPLWRSHSIGADHALEPAKPRRPSSSPCTRESLWVAGPVRWAPRGDLIVKRRGG